MKTYQKRFALFFIGLFFAFSFNAYACVVPIYGAMNVSQGSDCTTPGEEPVSQFCDGFKTLAVHTGHHNPTTSQSHIPVVGEPASLIFDLVQHRTFIFPPDTGYLVFKDDILLRISVLRI